MTREEAVALLERYSNYDGMGIPNLAGCKEAMKVAVESLKEVYPELKESEDERIRKAICHVLNNADYGIIDQTDYTVSEMEAYLEKQKEPHYTKRNALFDKCVAECDPAVMKEVSDEIDEMLEKEQKPWKVGANAYFTPAEDMPYITGEHFFEREPKESFRYKLAEYMTKNSRKEESPDGYTYHISAEIILEMAKEELLKRGELKEQKPAEWSEEDEIYLQDALWCVKQAVKVAKTENDVGTCWSAESWLKSLRPSWKPSEEQMDALDKAINKLANPDVEDAVRLSIMYDNLKKLI